MPRLTALQNFSHCPLSAWTWSTESLCFYRQRDMRIFLTISGNLSSPWSSSLSASSERNWTLVSLNHQSIWIHNQATLSKSKQQQKKKYCNIQVNENSMCGVSGSHLMAQAIGTFSGHQTNKTLKISQSVIKTIISNTMSCATKLEQ